MLKLYIKISLCFFLHLLVHNASAQLRNAEHEHIGMAKGLSTQLCRLISEDQLGNIIIAGQYQIHVYDGFEIQRYDHYNSTLSDNYIYKILPFGENKVLIVQADDIKNKASSNSLTPYFINPKFSVYNSLTKKWDSIESLIGRESPLNLNKIRNVYEREDHLLFLTLDHQLYRVNKEVEYIGQLECPGSNIIDLGKGDFYYSLEEDNLVKRDFKNIKLKEWDDLNLHKLKHFIVDPSGQLIITELFPKYSKVQFLINDEFETRQFKRHHGFNAQTITHYSSSFNFNSTVYEDWNINLIGAQIHVQGESYNDFIPSDDGMFYLISNYHVSKSGLLFVTTDKGVEIYDLEKKQFEQFHSKEIGNRSVRAIYMDDDLEIYSSDSTVQIRSPNNKYDLKFWNSNPIKSVPSTIIRDKTTEHDRVFFGGWIRNGIRIMDLNAHTFEYPKIEGLKSIFQLVKSNSTNEIYASSDKLFLFDGENFNRITNIDLEQLSAIQHLVNKDDKIWIGCENGVKIFDPASKSIVPHPILDTFNQKISYIYHDKIDENIVWLGTRQNGLFKLDLNTGEHEHLNTKNKLSNNSIHCIFEDAQQRLWIPTNNNLNCLEKQTGQNHIFTVDDGIPNQEFNRQSNFHDKKTGEYYFGGLNGYVKFNPDSIFIEKENNIHLRPLSAIVTLSDFQKENKFIELLTNQKLELSENIKAINISFSTNHLINCDKINFYYKILGLEDDWKALPHNELSLGRLDYGSYTIGLIADLHKPNSKSSVYTFDLTYLRPWYKTLLFRATLLLLFLYLMNWGFQRRIKNIQKRNDELEEIVSARTEELNEANRIKNKILAIASHDLKSPINSLKDIGQKINFLVAKNRVQDIEEITSQTNSKIIALNDSLDNILMWSLTELNQLKISKNRIPIKLEFEKALNIYSQQIQVKNLKIKFNIEQNIFIKSDLAIVQAILRNIIANAIKFSHQDGIIEIFEQTSSTDQKIFVVKDYGIGFPKENENLTIKNLRNELKGNEIGLMLTQQLAELIDLEIEINKEVDKGAEIILNFS